MLKAMEVECQGSQKPLQDQLVCPCHPLTEKESNTLFPLEIKPTHVKLYLLAHSPDPK